VRWVEEHGKADYMSMKQAICAYVARQAFPLLKRGIRINAICPGPTDTPLAQANKEMWLGFGADYRGETGIEPSTPLEQAYALVFLCSDAAVAINGITLISDAGYMSSGITGSFPDATPIANLLLNR
jgi:NAD(P)-dependent dehydrogenase (short-subunit alcohol dehydrogenase family)